MTSADLTIRPFTDAELPAALSLLELVFGERIEPEDVAAERSVVDVRRSQAAFDGDALVGCMATYSHDLSVPGGSVRCGGLTWVAVAPTHRRRGVLRRLMAEHLAEVRRQEEPIAALWASEPAIYGRWGYGLAAEQLGLQVAVDGAVQWEAGAAPPADAVRLVPVADAAAVLDPIYEAVRRRRGGIHRRSTAWWGLKVLSERPAALGGAAYKAVAVASIDGRDVAYAVYGMAEKFTDAGRPDGTIILTELVGIDPAAEAAMWRYLAGIDLVSTVRAPRRPVDDPLPLLLTDSRRVRRQVTDSLYVRIMDVPAALGARSYADSSGVTIEVRDEHVEACDGTWRVEVAPEGAAVVPTTDAPDLVLDVRALGSLYLGGITVGRLAAAGAVEVRTPGVVAELDAALRPAELPWAPEVW